MKLFVNSNALVALVAGSLSAGVALRFHIEHFVSYGIFSFCATMAVYNFHRLMKPDRAAPTDGFERTKDYRRIRGIVVVILTLVALVILQRIIIPGVSTAILLLVNVLIASFYVIRFRGIMLRELPFLKSHLVSISWTAIVIVLPLVNTGLNSQALSFGFAHYFYFLAVTIPFDIRDLKYDSGKMKTLPQYFGIVGAKWIGAVSLLLFAVMMFRIDHALSTNPVFYFAIAMQFLLLIKMDENRTAFYTKVAVDGSILFLSLSYFL